VNERQSTVAAQNMKTRNDPVQQLLRLPKKTCLSIWGIAALLVSAYSRAGSLNGPYERNQNSDSEKYQMELLIIAAVKVTKLKKLERFRTQQNRNKLLIVDISLNANSDCFRRCPSPDLLIS
jgi:hypothetical protein